MDLRTSLLRDDATRPLVERLDALPVDGPGPVLPEGDALVSALLRLTVPHAEIDPMLAAVRLLDDPEVRWLWARCTHLVVQSIGKVAEASPLVRLPAALGPVRPWFWALVHLAALPHTQAFHRRVGVAEEVSWATLADLGRHLAVHRWGTGGPGLAPGAGRWLWLHLTGQLYDLGRLQFQRATIDERTGRATAEAGLPWRAGDPALSVHIPRFTGPMTVEGCDRAFARAAKFFPAHFPDESYAVAVCKSWLLDPTLRDHLDPSSNIVAFQRRFALSYPPEVDDAEPLAFVFGRSDVPLADHPQDTGLQRAMVGHLRRGGHWHVASGWTTL